MHFPSVKIKTSIEEGTTVFVDGKRMSRITKIDVNVDHTGRLATVTIQMFANVSFEGDSLPFVEIGGKKYRLIPE
jgi:hypothetical protein